MWVNYLLQINKFYKIRHLLLKKPLNKKKNMHKMTLKLYKMIFRGGGGIFCQFRGIY